MTGGVPEDHPGTIVRPFWANGHHTLNGEYLDSAHAEQPDPPLPDLEIVSAASLAGRPIPARPWLVRDIIPDRQVTLLTGDGGVGKSLLALQLAVATATGTDWIGTLPEAGPVLYIGAEDELEEFHRRLVDIAGGTGAALDAYGDLHLLCLAGKDAVLAAPDAREGLIAMTPLWRAIEGALERLRPRLTIFDNSADVFAGNEVARAQVRQFVGTLRGAAINHSMAALLLSHPSLNGIASGSGTSGSTAWSNSVRSRLYLDRPKSNDDEESDLDARILKVMKANYAGAGAETPLRWQAGMLRLDGPGLTKFERITNETEVDRLFLTLLDNIREQGREVSHNPCITYAPKVFNGMPEGKSISKEAFRAAMERLFEAKKIAVVTTGPQSKRRSHIVRREL